MFDLLPRTTESGATVLDIVVRGKRTKVHLEFYDGGDSTWVPGQGYVGPVTEPSVVVVDNRRRPGGGSSFCFIKGPNLFQDLTLDLLHRLT